jgi:PiT family inorganic phosphate transporter
MTSSLFLMTLTIVIALGFDLINGFHDAANSIATVVSTRVLKPRTAVLWAAFFNFIAMFIFAPHVADTISRIVHIQPNDPVYLYVVLSGLLGAMIWDLITWWLGLPTSSSHALIGGVAGAGITNGGLASLDIDRLISTIEFIVIAPLMGFALGSFLIVCMYWIFRRWTLAHVNQFFRKAQLFSAGLYSLGHGGNDAQKTMGTILAVLIAGGVLRRDAELSLLDPSTLWIILSCHLAMAIGTAFGGWRIVKTMGMKITKLKPMGGFCAETAGAMTLFLATHFGIPVSTTHTITGAIIGVGSASVRLRSIKWGVAAKIVWAWVLTIPAAGLLSSMLFYLLNTLRSM